MANIPDVDNDCLGRIREDRSEVVGVLLVPAETHEGRQVGSLVDNRGVLEGSEVKHPHAAVGAHGGEDILRP